MSGPSSAFGKDVPDHGVSKVGGELTERQKMERGLPCECSWSTGSDRLAQTWQWATKPCSSTGFAPED
jgi:hypothetical protein